MKKQKLLVLLLFAATFAHGQGTWPGITFSWQKNSITGQVRAVNGSYVFYPADDLNTIHQTAVGNGLTYSGGQLKLGGTLSSSTLIDLNASSILLTGATLSSGLIVANTSNDYTRFIGNNILMSSIVSGVTHTANVYPFGLSFSGSTVGAEDFLIAAPLESNDYTSISAPSGKSIIFQGGGSVQSDIIPSNPNDLVRLVDLSAYAPATGSITYLAKADTSSFVRKFGNSSITNLNYKINGTGGNGYILFPAQSSAPATPSAGNQVIYANASGGFTMLGSNGFSATLSKSGLTASRTYTLPDASGTFALASGLNGDQTIFGSTLSGGNLWLSSSANSTKGRLYFGSHAYWDEASDITGYPGIQILNNSNLNEAALFFRRDLNNGSIYFSYNTAQTGGSGALIFGNPTNQAMYLNSQGYLAIGYGLMPSYSLDLKPMYGNYTGSSPLTTNGRGVNLDMQGSLFNTTAGALTSTGIYINNRGTRSTGSNGLTNRGLYVTASGAQNNYAAIFDGSVGILTADPTHSLTLASVSTGLMYWNSVDQVTNREGLLFKPVSNVYTWDSQSGGTGTARGWAWAVNGTQKATIDINGLFTASSNIVTLGRFGVNVSNPASLTGWVNIGGTSAYTTSAAFGTAGFGLNIMPGTYNSQAGAGSPSLVGVHTIGAPTLTATSAQAISAAATFFIAGSPIAGTNTTIASPYSFYIASGALRTAGVVRNAASADKTTNYPVTTDDDIVPCNSSGGAFNVTLLSTAPIGQIYTIDNWDGTSNSVTVVGTINGVTNYTLNAGKTITVYKTASGSNTWKILYNN